MISEETALLALRDAFGDTYAGADPRRLICDDDFAGFALDHEREAYMAAAMAALRDPPRGAERFPEELAFELQSLGAHLDTLSDRAKRHLAPVCLDACIQVRTRCDVFLTYAPLYRHALAALRDGSLTAVQAWVLLTAWCLLSDSEPDDDNYARALLWYVLLPEPTTLTTDVARSLVTGYDSQIRDPRFTTITCSLTEAANPPVVESWISALMSAAWLKPDGCAAAAVRAILADAPADRTTVRLNELVARGWQTP